MLTSFNESRVGLMNEDDDISDKAYFSVEHKRCFPLSYAALWTIVLMRHFVGYQFDARWVLFRKAPAEDVVKYEMRTYSLNDGDTFQSDPSAEVDKARETLYKNSTSRIPKSIAEQLPNKTSEIYGATISSAWRCFISCIVWYELPIMNR
ncbi:hypothetical protein D9619_006879 [Psilocybe cf. subviscida]|uniref:Uncharacterized protein n=1 Tax=Psilocybe cf. subviscida TaxID=2480587 RepID=A0A8H5B4E6_9AGAR|nr:hypothetical protein D9619_006879 [Psilocybe cf. subviscida]